MHPLSPDALRAWRGDRPRSAVAALLGVTPLTVYRWELPEDAAESRRPRGLVARRVEAVVGGVAPAAPLPPAAAVPAAPPSEAGAPSANPAEAADLARVAAWADALAHGAVAATEDAVLDALARESLATVPGRAAAAAVLARARLLQRGDVSAALSGLLPWLDAVERPGWPAEAAAHVLLAAAVLRTQPHGGVFDAARAAAHLAALRALGPVAHARATAVIALGCEASACFFEGDTDAATRLLSAADLRVQPTDAPLYRALLTELQGHAALVSGRPGRAAERLGEAAADYEAAGFPLYAARAGLLRGMRLLDDAHSPAEALAVARHAAGLLTAAGAAVGQSHLYFGRVAGESLVRLGRFEEAEAELLRGMAAADAVRWAPHPICAALMRLYVYTGRYDDALALSVRLQAWDGTVQRPIVRAYGVLLEGWTLVLSGGDPARALVQVGRAVESADASSTWAFLQREARVLALLATVRLDRTEAARAALVGAERMLERLPSTWYVALVRRARGVLALREGRHAEGCELLEASRAAFRLAGDRPEALIAAHILAKARIQLGEPGAAEEWARVKAEMDTLGIRPAVPVPFEVPAAPPARRDRADLSVSVERLALRGVGPARIAEELVAVVSGLVPGRAVAVEEVPPGRADATPGAAVDFGDGTGRHLRLTVEGAVSEAVRADLLVLTNVAGLAMELAAVRGYGSPPPAPVPVEDPRLPGFVAASPAMRDLRDQVARLAASRATVVITGESGSGKEVVARAVHTLSGRARAPFFAFNCATVPRDLFEGQLFGYRKGAFTGASADHPGVLRAADGGTLFLDEVAELPLDVQPKLLRVLENGEILPLGERRPIRVDVRVVAATHRDLARAVADGRFREDLYYRLHVVPLRVPALRERPEDILALARHFLRSLTPADQVPPPLAPDGAAALVAYPWPGNVRELRNVLERALAFAPTPGVVTARVLGLD